MNLQDRLSGLLGISPDARAQALINMYQATDRHPLAYWLQLAIAAGIAQLGLVLNSTGVVIGAMLVSPLMTPIIQVGVSFSIGHPYLAARSVLRILKSLVFVVGLAALMTLLLPFHELTGEILARTQPTALDLAVALFCGLAAAFTTARNAHDVFTAAAGTAIAIALVPPLCVAGFGLGIANLTVATGSLLLFTANLSAIILVTDLFFLVLGFGKTDSQLIEPEAIRPEDRQSLLFRGIRSPRFTELLARWRHLRLILPLVFVVAVAFPLGIALKRVSWEINTKKRVEKVLDDFEKRIQVLKRQSTVSHGAVSVRLTVVDSPVRETALRNELLLKLAAAVGSPPRLSLEVLPSSEFMSQSLQQSNEMLNRQLAEFRYGTAGNGSPQGSGNPSAGTFLALETSLRQRCQTFFDWLRQTGDAAGWIGWSLSLDEQGTQLSLFRLAEAGAPPADSELLAAVFAKEYGAPIKVREDRIPVSLFVSDRPTAKSEDLDQAERLAEQALAKGPLLRVRLQLRDPQLAPGNATRRAWTKMNDLLLDRLKRRFSAEQLEIVEPSPRWAITLTGGTPTGQSKPAEAGLSGKALPAEGN